MTSESHEHSDRLLEAALVGIATVWDQVALECGGPTPAGSQCSDEFRRYPSSVDEPEALARAIATDAVIYISAASQQLRALAVLVNKPEFLVASWPVVRSVVEHCSRAAWLLEPVEGGDPAPRIARFYMERIVAAGHAKNAASAMKDRPTEKKLRKLRNAYLKQAKELFPDTEIYESLEKTNAWSVGGEPYRGLTKSVNTFGREQLKATGLYDSLSSFTHPSTLKIGAQTKVTKLEDKLHSQFVDDQLRSRGQIGIACSAVYRAGHHVTSYLAMSDQGLEAWYDSYYSLFASHAPSSP